MFSPYSYKDIKIIDEIIFLEMEDEKSFNKSSPVIKSNHKLQKNDACLIKENLQIQYLCQKYLSAFKVSRGFRIRFPNTPLPRSQLNGIKLWDWNWKGRKKPEAVRKDRHVED